MTGYFIVCEHYEIAKCRRCKRKGVDCLAEYGPFYTESAAHAWARAEWGDYPDFWPIHIVSAKIIMRRVTGGVRIPYETH